MIDKINKLIEISEFMNDNETVIQLKQLAISLEDKSYLLSIMGQFSAGKSSLINNLFGKKILPVHTTETTARITFIKYGEEEYAELIKTDGSIDFVSIEDSIEIWQTGEKADLINDIECITIYLPSDLLKNGLIIADTPGTNTVFDKHIELTENLIASSDCVLYVLGKQITETDKRFVKAIKDFGTNIVFVRTYMDQIKKNEENSSDTIEKEKQTLSELSPEEVFFVSNDKESEFYNEIYDLQAFLSCTIAENVSEAIRDSVSSKLEYLIKKQQEKILNRKKELGLLLDGKNEEYKQNKNDILSSLENLESNLEQKRERVRDKYIKEKESAKEELAIIKHSEEKKLIVYINNSEDNMFMSEYYNEINQLIRDAFINMRNGYIECFERIIRENKALFIEEMKQQKELSVWIPDIPDSLDESNSQINSLKDRMEALIELRKEMQEKLDEIEQSDQNLSIKSEALEEERKEIQEALEIIQNEYNSFPPYAAQYITLEGDHSHEKSFRVVGNIADWATIFIPGPTWAKFAGKVLNVGAKGAKVVKAVKVADAFADGARVLAKVAKGAESGAKVAKNAKKFEKGARMAVDAIDMANKGKKAVLANKISEQIGGKEFLEKSNLLPADNSPFLPEDPKPTLLDYIDIGYWFSKIGKNFDIPDAKVIDVEYENLYKTEKNKIEMNMRLQARKEFEKRKQQEELKTKEEENQLEKEILIRKERSAQEQIKELAKEIEMEKKNAAISFIRKHYIDAVKSNLNHFEDYILSDISQEISEKMEIYINTYDFKIKNDILSKKQELEDLDKKYNSSEKLDIERDAEVCQKYLEFLENALV